MLCLMIQLQKTVVDTKHSPLRAQEILCIVVLCPIDYQKQKLLATNVIFYTGLEDREKEKQKMLFPYIIF